MVNFKTANDEHLIEGYKKCCENKQRYEDLLNTGVDEVAKEGLQLSLSKTNSYLQKYLTEINIRGLNINYYQ